MDYDGTGLSDLQQKIAVSSAVALTAVGTIDDHQTAWGHALATSATRIRSDEDTATETSEHASGERELVHVLPFVPAQRMH